MSQVGGGVYVYSDKDIDGVREEWATYAATFIFKWNFLLARCSDRQLLTLLKLYKFVLDVVMGFWYI